jgi:hypothetical protein
VAVQHRSRVPHNPRAPFAGFLPAATKPQKTAAHKKAEALLSSWKAAFSNKAANVQSISPRTREDYVMFVGRFLLFLESRETQWNECTADTMVEYFTAVARFHATTRKQVQTAVAALRWFFNHSPQAFIMDDSSWKPSLAEIYQLLPPPAPRRRARP